MVNKDLLGVGTVTIGEKAKQNVLAVLDAKRLTYGPFIQEFEKRFSKEHDVRFGVMMNSGTSALQVAIACLAEAGNWQPGDEVIVPALTFIATSNIVIQQGLKPVFVDVDDRTYNIDPTKIEAAITGKTKAIIAVHLFGQPADMDPILEIAKKHDLKVIEDSCETMFASYKGRRVGSLGDIACFSTYAAHIIVTGVGGIAVTDDPEYANIMRSIANHGRDGIYIGIDDDNGKTEDELKQIISRRFKFIRMGYSYRVTEFEGAVGCAQLDDADVMIRRRKENAAHLISKLSDVQSWIQLPWHPETTDHVFMMFPIVIKRDAPFSKKDFVEFLELNGIETRDMLPLTNQPFYQASLGLRESDYPVSEWINTHGFYVGCHQDMGEDELDYLSEKIIEFVERNTNVV